MATQMVATDRCLWTGQAASPRINGATAPDHEAARDLRIMAMEDRKSSAEILANLAVGIARLSEHNRQRMAERRQRMAEQQERFERNQARMSAIIRDLTELISEIEENIRNIEERQNRADEDPESRDEIVRLMQRAMALVQADIVRIDETPG